MRDHSPVQDMVRSGASATREFAESRLEVLAKREERYRELTPFQKLLAGPGEAARYYVLNQVERGAYSTAAFAADVTTHVVDGRNEDALKATVAFGAGVAENSSAMTTL